jgi:hypothetical protein
MKTITVLEKAYGKHRKFALRAFRHSLSVDLEGLEVLIGKLYTNPHSWVVVELEGEDWEVASNLIQQYYGTICSFGELKAGQVRKGKLIQTGKYGYGLYADIGIDSEERIDAFIPLHAIRHQLVKNEKIPLRDISYACGFLDNFTLEISIDRIDSIKENIQASLSSEQVQLFKKWMKLNLERLIVTGVTRKHLKKVIGETGHINDILAIERMGLLEQVVVCKEGTNAPGLLAEIGRFLPEALISLFIPEKVRAILA